MSERPPDWEIESLLRYLHEHEKVPARKVWIETIGGKRVAKVERVDGTVGYFTFQGQPRAPHSGAPVLLRPDGRPVR